MRTINWIRDYRWQLVLIVLLGSIINYTDRVNLSFATNIRDEFGLSPLQWGYLLGAWMWPYAIANLPAGWLIDKFGIGRMYTWSLAIWSLATFFCGFSHNFATLYIMRVILGIAEAPFFIIAGKLIKIYFLEDYRGRAVSIINLGPKIANGFTPPLIVLLIIIFGWRGMLIAFGIIGISIVILWKLFYKSYDDRSTTDDVNDLKVFSSWKLFFHRSVVFINLGNFASSYIFWLYFTWLPTYLIDNRGLNLQQAGWMDEHAPVYCWNLCCVYRGIYIRYTDQKMQIYRYTGSYYSCCCWLCSCGYCSNSNQLY